MAKHTLKLLKDAVIDGRQCTKGTLFQYYFGQTYERLDEQGQYTNDTYVIGMFLSTDDDLFSELPDEP